MEPTVSFRSANREDLDAIVRMLAEDPLGATRETHSIPLRGCHVVQLTTDKSRAEARSVYESLGFAATHKGMKLHL